MADERRDAAAAADQHHVVERIETSAHASVRPVDEGPVGLLRPPLERRVEHLPGESAVRVEDEGHVPVLLAELGGKVVGAERGDGEGVVFEDRDGRDAQIHELTGLPPDLRGDRDPDGVLGEERDGGLVADEPRRTPRVGPVELEDPEDVAREPDRHRRPEIVPRRQVVLTVPEEQSRERDRRRNMEGDEQFVHPGPEKRQGRDAEPDESDEARDACKSTSAPRLRRRATRQSSRNERQALPVV